MKTRLFYAILVAVGICLQGCTTSYAKDREDAKETPAGERLEISFRFQRGGIASSQYAIWIEDETGKLVRTLYVTSFTAKGGYEYRKDAVPTGLPKLIRKIGYPAILMLSLVPLLGTGRCIMCGMVKTMKVCLYPKGRIWFL